MSPLLAVAIVLLVLVVGLTLLQRRGQVQPHAVHRKSSPPPAPPEPPDTSPSEMTAIKADPLLGTIGFHSGGWMTDTDLNLHGTLVLVEIAGSIDGPTNADHEIVRAALATPDLETRARALVIAELERRRVGVNDVSAYSLAVRPDEDGVLHGFLWFAAEEFLGDIGVKSADMWRKITLEVEE